MRAFYIPNKVYKSGGRLIVQNASGTFYNSSEHLKPYLKYFDEDKICSNLIHVSDYRLLLPSINWVIPEEDREYTHLSNGFKYSQPVLKTPFNSGVIWLPTFELELSVDRIKTDAEQLSYLYERPVAIKTNGGWILTELKEELNINKDCATLVLNEVAGNNFYNVMYEYVGGIWTLTSCQYTPIQGIKEL